MNGLIEVDSNLRILTRPPQREDLARLARGEVASIVNLRTSGEEGAVLEPEEEGELARSEGLDYAHVPVTSATLNGETAKRVSSQIERLPGPVVIHCASGKRAGLMALSHWARQQGTDAQGAADKARELGLEYSPRDFQSLLGGEASR